MRIAFEKSGAECRLTSEIDENAMKTYRRNFVESPSHQFIPDVREVARFANLGELAPEVKLVLAGFPCQPFSIAGLRKGLSDERGKIFTSILDIISQETVQAFVLENVRGIMSHDRGSTFAYMLQELGRRGFPGLKFSVLNSMTHGGVPQNRERVFIVGFRDEKNADAFDFPSRVELRKSLADVMESHRVDDRYYYDGRFDCYTKLREAVTKRNTAYQWRRVVCLRAREQERSCPCPDCQHGLGWAQCANSEGSFRNSQVDTTRMCKVAGFPRKVQTSRRYGGQPSVPPVWKLYNRQSRGSTCETRG